MASNVFVLDSAFKRTQVKVTPGTHMRNVLEEACKARKWDPESYALKTQTNKTVDLSQPFRLSGLTSGAKLTLIQASRSPSVVNVALQLPESEGGGRLSDKFPSTTSLWLVLRKYEDAVAGQPPRKLNLTQRGVPPTQSAGSGRLEYEQPCLHLLGRNLESFVDLQKTLAQLGLNSGSVLIRLSFKSVGQPLDEAMQEIEQYFNAVNAPSTESESAQGAHAVASGSLQSAPDEPKVDRDSPMPDADAPTTSAINGGLVAASSSQVRDSAGGKGDDDASFSGTIGTDNADHASVLTSDHVGAVSTPAQERASPRIPAISPDSEAAPPLPKRTSIDGATKATSISGIAVYNPPSNNTPAAAIYEEDPQTFEPSIDHAKAHQAALTRMTQNRKLLSDKELAEKAEAQQAALAEVKTVTVRVKYPDQSMIETRITAASSPHDLYTQVNDTLESKDAIGNYQLKFMGTKGMQVLPDVTNKRLVKDFAFKGAVLVTIVWASGASAKVREGPCLKTELRNVAKDLKVELGNQRKEGEAKHKAAMDKKPTGAVVDTKGGKSRADMENKLKKLMGFGKK